MLLPNRMKHRKVRKGRVRGVATAGNYIAFGDYALQAQGQERITSRQIEAARQAMTRYIKARRQDMDSHISAHAGQPQAAGR